MRILNSHTETYPCKGVLKKAVTLIAVLACGVLGEGSKGDTAVYVGTVDLGDYESDPTGHAVRRANAETWIAHNGVKQTFAGARRYFPGIIESDYRA